MKALRSLPEPSIAEKFQNRDRLIAAGRGQVATAHSLYLGDAREMQDVAPGTAHLVVTSPPYWTLKEYAGDAGDAQLGHRSDYADFLSELAKVWQRCFDSLVPGGRLCVVIGDVCLPRRRAGRHFVVPLHADISRQCIGLGFDYLTPILWHKIANAVTEVEGRGAFLGKPYEPNGIVKNDIEYILLFRKPGAYRTPTAEQRLLSLIDKADHARWFRSIWTDVPGQVRNQGHPAPFPVEVAYRLIRMFSFVGDNVLDPFIGTGSTAEAAIQAQRNSVGYEIEPKYYDLQTRRFAETRANARIIFSA